MTLPRLAVLDDYQDVAFVSADWSALDGRVALTRFGDTVSDTDALAARLAPFDIIVAMRERTAFDEALLSRLPNLKLLITTGMANAAIDMDAARRRGVIVCGTRGSVGPAAELAWGLLLALKRNLAAEAAHFRGSRSPWQISIGGDLKQTTLGVVGLGKLGQRVAGYGKAFEMEVLGWTRTDAALRCAALGIGHAASLDDLLERSDVVSLHLTLNAGTRGIIGARELGLMKPGAVLVNTSRGPLVDEAALVAALEEGRIGGAALDVFEHEPLPARHPFRTLPNVVATPHLGYVTRETYAVYYRDAVEDVLAWLAGAPVRVVNQPS